MLPHEASEPSKANSTSHGPPVEASTDEQARRDALIQQAWVIFQGELPLLAEDHPNEWVAYHGTRKVGFGKTRAELWQACLRQGLPEGEFWVWNIALCEYEEAIGFGLVEQSDSGDLARQALLAFWRDLPRLLRERPRQWVAYHGERQLGIAPTRAELWAECLRQGLKADQFLIRSIEPEDPDLVLGWSGGE